MFVCSDPTNFCKSNCVLEVRIMTCKGIVLVFPGPGRVNGLPVSGQPAAQLGQPLLPQQQKILRYRRMRFLLLATVKTSYCSKETFLEFRFLVPQGLEDGSKKLLFSSFIRYFVYNNKINGFILSSSKSRKKSNRKHLPIFSYNWKLTIY
jgi:hypothetical protein